ncbi:hypothetical protein CR513_23600, partial [Mucuna pruriens]
MVSFYVLQGSTVVGVVSISSSLDSNLNPTHLWHMLLKYIGWNLLETNWRVKFSSFIHRTKNIVDYIYHDVLDPIFVLSKGGARYFLTLID